MASGLRLEAAGGLALELPERGPWRVAFDEPDWLGPVGIALRHKAELLAGLHSAGADLARPALDLRLLSSDGSDAIGEFRGCELALERSPPAIRASVRAYASRSLLVFRLEAADDLRELATGSFAEPSAVWPWLEPARRLAGGVPEGTRAFGHQFTEFALPTSADASCSGFFLLSHRPPVVEPLLLMAPDGRTLLLAPLDGFHEQVIAVPSSRERAVDGIRCGWQGDLAEVDRGFATELALLGGSGPRHLLEEFWQDADGGFGVRVEIGPASAVSLRLETR